MSHNSDSTGPSGADFAPPPGPPPGLSERHPAPSKPHDTQVESAPGSASSHAAPSGPSPVTSGPPPVHLGPTSNYSEPSPIDLEHPSKRFGALPTPSGLQQVHYGSDQASSANGTAPSQSIPPQQGASSGHPSALALQGDKNSTLPDIPELADTASPLSGLNSKADSLLSSTSQSQLPPSELDATPRPSQTGTPLGHIPPPPPGQPDKASQPSQTGAPLANIPPPPSKFPPPPNQLDTASQQSQASTPSSQVPPPPPPQFPPPPNKPDASSQPSKNSTASDQIPPPPPQFPPPPGQYETPTKPGFVNLPKKFHIWATWEKGQGTDGHSIPCIELGPELFGPPAYSAKMAESLAFKVGRWPDNGPTVGEVTGKGTFTTQSVLVYNGFQTEFGNTGTTLVDIGSIGVWQFNVPIRGRDEAWEWRRVKDPSSTGGLMSKLSKMAGLVGSLVLVPSGSPGGTTPFATWTKSHGSKFKKESDLGVLEFHGPASTEEMGDAFQALAIMSIVKIQQDNRDETVAGMIKGSFSGSG